MDDGKFSLQHHVIDVLNSFNYPTIRSLNLVRCHIKLNAGNLIDRAQEKVQSGKNNDHIYYSSLSPQHQKGTQILQKMLKEFSQGSSSLNKAVKSLAESAGYDTSGFVSLLQNAEDNRQRREKNLSIEEIALKEAKSDHPRGAVRIALFNKIPNGEEHSQPQVLSELKSIMQSEPQKTNISNLIQNKKIHNQNK